MIDWLFDFIGVCRKHRIRTEWDGGQLCYVCPKCERNPERMMMVDRSGIQHLRCEVCEAFGCKPSESVR
jgi:hypothetical protein